MMFFSFLLLLVGVAFAKVQFMGMNLAGFDFGCDIDGTCSLGGVQPLPDASGQIAHFANDDQMNIFRFPVSWQFLANNKIGGALDATNLAKYDQVMQICLRTGALCAIDIHNYARVDNKIIGQGGPSDAQFADLWAQLATKYRANDKVIFGLMNEPHDVDINIWANTVQAAVTAIRNAGAMTQMILMPGNDFSSAGAFVPNGSGAALLKVVNPDGSTTGLIMDLHKYLDINNSGTHSTCTTNNIDTAFAVVATFLRENKRLAIVSETGAGSDASCFTNFCAQNTFLNQNSDVFLGYVAWAAGSFDSSYVLSLTPTKKDGKYVDNTLATECVIKPWLDAAAGPSSDVAASETTTLTQISTRTRVVETVTSGIVTITTTNAPTSDVPTTISFATITSIQNGTATSTGRVGNSGGETSNPVQFASAGDRNLARGLFISGLVATLSMYAIS